MGPVKSAAEMALHLLDTGTFADFTIHCGGYSWNTHRAIISQRSAYFASLCESQFKEASDQAVTLEEDDPNLVARLLVFLYGQIYPVEVNTDSFSDQKEQLLYSSLGSLQRLLSTNETNNQVDVGIWVSDRENPLSIAASLYAVTDKYECLSLKAACEKIYIETLRGRFSIPDFIGSIDIVYETTPETDKGLRQWAVIVSQGYKEMLQPHPSFKALFRSRPDYTWDLATGYMEVRRYWCEKCGSCTLSETLKCICGSSSICGKGERCCERFRPPSCENCDKSEGLQPCGLAPASNNARSRFKDKSVDTALRNAMGRMR